ncbi:oxidation resistance protein 1 isoform X3 [Cylas formicarius]|uniref:oxidation resistance protein 1 isoform X3 n=1 Tax=Cylas formicarius TaxID=197179 RepID=UPI0029584A9B|nr:oxidation resistance protein 1 isoform X3 [Cylas formicarius]
MSQKMLQVVPEKELRKYREGSWPDIKSIQEEEEEYVDKKARRKSWHAIKFEKKRRKGVAESNSPPVARREKRGSWWNIFANQPRSKSRSVDHGISSPYDVDELRRKVDIHGSLNRDIDGSTNSLSERKRTGPPENTTVYNVADRDTLTSVAARFDTTPSELTKLNRLGTPYIFPGQQLYVPLRESIKDESEGSTPVEDLHDDLPAEEKELLENLRPVSPKPGHVERVRTPSTNQSISVEQDEEPISITRERFLKINVRHITDGEGVVAGVLLVTPNAVMFDPYVSDPLVIEKGPEAYGVVAPMEFVVNIAIYTDIAHMRVSHLESAMSDKAEIYYPKHEKNSQIVKDGTFSELVIATDDAESVCSCTEREGDAFPKAFERDLVTPTNLDNPENEHRSLEERRKSLLDHHWPMTSRERQSIDTDEIPAISSSIQEDSTEEKPDDDDDDDEIKQSCHDSGIDIRESSLPPVIPVPTKKQYSDADIVLSKDWVPPITIASLTVGSDTESPARKKTNSVSFSLDSSGDADAITQLSSSFVNSKEDAEKSDSKKNRMLKRLSYPLSWMETLGGDKDDEKSPSQVADTQSSSMFSKVFSSSPIHLDFRTSLFTKTPSEDSGSSGGPQSAGSGGPPLTGESGASSSSSFFPTNIISSVGASVGAVGAQVGAQVGAMSDLVGAQVGAIGSTVGAVGAQVGASVSAVGRSSVGTLMRQPTESSKKKDQKEPPPKLDYRSMVSVEDMPELFASFDKLIPTPARSCEDPPLYLRLRMGKPLNKKIPQSTPLMSYGKKKMRPEYWFSIPRNRVDEFYRFVQAWFPHLYGEIDEEKILERGFSLVEVDTELWSEEPTPSNSRHGSQGEEIAEISKESWELIKAPYVKIYNIIKTQTTSEGSVDETIPVPEEFKRTFYGSGTPSIDIEFTVPELIGTTEILTDYHRESLCRHLPARAEGYAWTLVFSTSQHGFSLNSMYRKMFKLESPVLLVIEDTDNNVFGALTSCALHVSDHFYGTGESLLFRFTPEFQVYNWTGENLYFIKGNNESLSIGAGDGKFGLWLDGDLYLGRSEKCKTYANESLTPKIDFVVKTLECWAFISC